ncbi:DNA-binding transcriptional activator of the SARP family [Streptomyces sp. 2231.1]|uniref:AfsR/SARP family transcriptional regulator n=1 Tax=Streptomyces sp. 2231.1 TaxID=1855347 RepID=UPI000894EABA|nr:tetratricopeptide repeat protein [Streptomyces sp. 2231.1]SEE36623.1 DNA-binding transcriptional activator of the SARP family [Streptomyces sp. 2231.1]
MNLHLLGPLELRVAGRAVDIGEPRRRAVLAALAADTGRPVPASTLVDRVWDTAAPDGARSALYSHISRLRRLLDGAASTDGVAPTAGGDGAAVPGTPLRIARTSGGYVLEADLHAVDLLRFRSLVVRAREPHLSDQRRIRLLGEALRLWRGVPLAGLPGAWAERTRTAWTQERLETALAWAHALLGQGKSEEVPAVLRPLLTEQPLNEPLAVLLIRGLATSGRAAEAVDTYTRIRRQLDSDLGVAPGRELRSAYEEVLHGTGKQQHAGTGPGPALISSPAPTTVPIPAQLPLAVNHFSGREEQLAELTRRLVTAEGPEAGTAAVVSGVAGIGKTALAVRWAHQMRDSYPDGQLYVDLRGYDPDEPVSAAQALSGFLSALGVPGPEIPLRLDHRAARYRTAVDGRRLLVLLDNAASAAQVRPLLPGSPTCKVVITSRDSLSSLVSLHGAHRVVLDVLSPDEALALLRSLIGPRVDTDRAAATALAEQCGRLPLALRVAAELALSRPLDPLARLVEELRDERRRLDLLDSGDGDPRAAVRAVFSWSYDRLPEQEARLFRLLGLHPGPDADVYAAATLTGGTAERARRSLDALSRAHLVHRSGPGRHAMHDLLRAYAAELTSRHDGAAERDAALTRLLDHCLAASAAAMNVLYPAERHLRPAVEVPGTGLPPLRTADECRAWLRAAQHTLVALCSRTEEPGPSRHTVRIATTLHRHYERSGHLTDALTVHTHALRAARAVGDTRGEVDVLACVGAVHRRLGDYESAHRHHADALSLCRRIGYAAGEARHLTNVGVLHELQGRYRKAAEHHERAVELFRAAGDAHGEADVLNNLGIVQELLEDYQASIERYEQALALYQRTGHTFGEASALGNLGIVLSRLDDHAAAAGRFEQALALFRRLGHTGGEAHALSNLGNALCRQESYDEAAEHQRQALKHFRRTGEPYGEAGALNGLGEALHGVGRHAEALDAYASALEVARGIGEQEEQARAHMGTALVRRARGERAHAVDHLHQAVSLYTALDSPRAEEARTTLLSMTAE